MMVVLEAPDGASDWHLAVEFYPPHRSEVLTKVRASVETATGLFINDTLPEENAARLAGLSVALPTERTQPAIVVRAGSPG
jgi:galactose-1-phosphate uridylyltransferase